MIFRAIEPPQRCAAKVAGVFYLLTAATAVFGEFYVRVRLGLPDATPSAANLAAQRLLRIGILSDLLTCAGAVVLAVALYILLKPINPMGAMLAVFWQLIECCLLASLTLNDFAIMRLVSGASHLIGFDAAQTQALARLSVAVQWHGARVAGLFFGLASIMFAYLWFKSRYVPRILAAWGILASLVPLFVSCALLTLPSLETLYGAVRRARSGTPIVSFEIILGIWLLMKGLREPRDVAGAKGETGAPAGKQSFITNMVLRTFFATQKVKSRVLATTKP